MSIQWRLNPVQIAQLVLIVALVIFGWYQWSSYMDAKYKAEEWRKQKAEAEAIIVEKQALLKRQQKRIENLQKKIREWNRRDAQIKIPMGFDDALRELGLE